MPRTSPLLRSLLAGGGDAALATAERKRRKKKCNDNHWLHRPSPTAHANLTEFWSWRTSQSDSTKLLLQTTNYDYYNPRNPRHALVSKGKWNNLCIIQMCPISVQTIIWCCKLMAALQKLCWALNLHDFHVNAKEQSLKLKIIKLNNSNKKRCNLISSHCNKLVKPVRPVGKHEVHCNLLQPSFNSLLHIIGASYPQS